KFRYELTTEWKAKEGIVKDNKQKPQTAEEIADPKSSKKQKVNKENQDPLREGSETGKRKKDKKEETK
ncbi:43279_t:CDS:2, partial [Gigaspora margarita]